MGKREIGELSVVDFIVSLYIAELIAISIENYKSNIFLSIIPIVMIVILELITSKVSMKSIKTRNILEGEPSIIIEQGKVNFKEMQKQRYNLDDLLMQLRNNSIKSIQDVDYAILETSGKLSIFKKEEQNNAYPMPLILDTVIQDKTLISINKNKDWLIKEIKKQNLNIENIFYAFYQDNNIYIIEKDKIK
jgi:uncharacterized membrane protein YcaP (DUF421 family)